MQGVDANGNRFQPQCARAQLSLEKGAMSVEAKKRRRLLGLSAAGAHVIMTVTAPAANLAATYASVSKKVLLIRYLGNNEN